MLDKHLLRKSPEEFKARLARRGAGFAELIDQFVQVDGQRRAGQLNYDTTKAELNKVSQEIGGLFKQGKKEEAETKRADAEQLKAEVKNLESTLAALDQAELDLLLSMPNLPEDSIPDGGEENAEVVKTWGEPRQFDFELKDHVKLCELHGLVDFEAGARLSGSGFPVMTGQGAMLQRALINLMLDTHITRHGYTELRPPFIVRPHCAVGTGNLPKFGNDMFHVTEVGQPLPEGDGLPHFFLIPTAEMALCNYYREQVLNSPELPIRFCAYSPCWRTEGGSYGKEARGLTRLRQFEKVELVRISDPESSYEDLEQITAEAEYILELLELPYRRKVLPAGDMAFGSAKTYDLEVYCPAEPAWREISSASNTTDYQARRANIRFKRGPDSKPEFPHLLNASGLALPRLMIAVLETYQNPDGSLMLPEPLRPYMGGADRIGSS
jgi:seryl-tRNA synthetase